MDVELLIETDLDEEAEPDSSEHHEAGRGRGAIVVGASVVGIVAGAIALGQLSPSESASRLPPVTPVTTTAVTQDPTTSLRPVVTMPVTAVGPRKSFFAGVPLFPGIEVRASILALSSAGVLVRFDPDDGGGVRRLLDLAFSEQAPLKAIARPGGVVVVGGDGSARFVPDNPAAAPVRMPDATGWIYAPSADGRTVWRLPRPGTLADDSLRAELIDPSWGLVLRAYPLPAAATPLVDDGTGGLLVRVPAGTFRLDGATGALALVSTAEVIAITPERLVELACSTPVSCQWSLVERASGAVVGQGTMLGRPGPADGPLLGSLSPDGRHLALPVFRGASLGMEVIDLTTGVTESLPTRGVLLTAGGPSPGLAWAPDSRTFVWLDGQGRLNAWSGGQTRVDEQSRVPDLVSASIVANG